MIAFVKLISISRLNQFFLFQLLIASLATGGSALGQQPLEINITDFSQQGIIQWTDVNTGPALYELEYRSTIDGSWRRFWENSLLFGDADHDGPTLFEQEVPMFFRIRKQSLSAAIPEPITDADYFENGAPSELKVELGKLLFFDKILSGNRNISCATCHHPLTGTGDLLSLPVGEGGRGLGPTRSAEQGTYTIYERVPRNANELFNRGAREFTTLFHDGRVAALDSTHSSFETPAGEKLPDGLENALAAQAMFPVTSATEMAGQAGENEIADLADQGNLPGLWETLAARLQQIPAYVEKFQGAFPNQIQSANDIQFKHAANAIAAFESVAFRSDRSPFDAYIRGEREALSPTARQGMALFYGKAGCANCHSGPFQTDHKFYAMAMPQIGPGKGDGWQGLEDYGRERVTGSDQDRYKFRTPSLRNVVLTGPWGHDGAYNQLDDTIQHMLTPIASLNNYTTDKATLPHNETLEPKDFALLSHTESQQALAEASALQDTQPLTPEERHQLLQFLESLTDPYTLNFGQHIPMRVPSGLPVGD